MKPLTPEPQPVRARAMPSPRRPFGVTLFGIVLIATSLVHLRTLLEVDHYWWLFESMPEPVLRLRYFCSVWLRVLGLASGIGLLRRQETFRKAAMAVGIVTMATVYWKHPWFAVNKLAQSVIDMFAASSGLGYLFTPSLRRLVAVFSLIGLYVFDLAFSIWLLVYLTRPHVTAWFHGIPERVEKGKG